MSCSSLQSFENIKSRIKSTSQWTARSRWHAHAPKTAGKGHPLWLVEIYWSYVSFNHVPHSWRSTEMVFISEPENHAREYKKHFRPISITSFILKTLTHPRYFLIDHRSEVTLLEIAACLPQRRIYWNRFSWGDVHGLVVITLRKHTPAAFLHTDERAPNDVSP